MKWTTKSIAGWRKKNCERLFMNIHSLSYIKIWLVYNDLCVFISDSACVWMANLKTGKRIVSIAYTSFLACDRISAMQIFLQFAANGESASNLTTESKCIQKKKSNSKNKRNAFSIHANIHECTESFSKSINFVFEIWSRTHKRMAWPLDEETVNW